MNKNEILRKLKYYFRYETMSLYNDLRTNNNIEFIKVIKDVKVDSLNEINTYTISILYHKRNIDKIDNHIYWTFETLVIDQFNYTWEEIKEYGAEQINNDIKKTYCIG